MKKKLTRMLAVLLIAMMLIPTIATLATTVQAAETTDASAFQNQYDATTEFQNAVPSPDYYGKSLTAANHRGSAPFAVTGGQTIYFGPCDPDQQWYLVIYKLTSSSKSSGKQIQSTQVQKVATFIDGSVICSYTIPEGYVAAAYAHKMAKYNHNTLITVDQPFDVDGYYAYADLQGWDLIASGLRKEIAAEPEEGYEGLWNYFPAATERDPLLRQHQNNTFISSAFIKVNAKDTIYIGALNRDDYLKKPTKDSEHHVVTAYDENYNQLSTVRLSNLYLEEDIGYGYGIYAYEVPRNISGTVVAYVRVDVHEGIYNDGDVFVTKNQPFTGEQFRQMLGIAELSEEAKAHPFYGKKALFIGDSISYGSYDTPPTYSNPSASWARRLALATGLIPTNVSYPGASVGKNSNCKWIYEIFNTEYISKKTYDMIVFHGGVNDARQGVAVGEALSSDTDRKILAEDERLATFAGSLQLIFHKAREKWPEAELYYVANFKLVSDSLKGRDMNDYLTQAKILCAEYGVHYIDLFEDETLYETFDYTSKDILPDLIHPTAITYDLLFPTILRLFNETIVEEDNDQKEDNDQEDNNKEDNNVPEKGDENQDVVVPEENPTPVVPDTPNNGAADTDTAPDGLQQTINNPSILSIFTTLLLLPLGWLLFPLMLLIMIL